MRIIWFFILLGFGWPLDATQNSGSIPKKLWVDKREYVDVAGWAEARQLVMFWPRKTDELRLSNRWARLHFKLSSRRAEINGVAVWLSFPILSQNERAWIAQADLTHLIHPILFPPLPTGKQRIKIIALDPGHGGRDPGNQDGAQQEKRHTLLLAQEVQKQLARVGLKGVLTRTTDEYVDLDERPVRAKRLKADLFISLHYNSVSATRSEAKGVEVYCLTPSGETSTNDTGEESGQKPWPGNLNNSWNVMLAYQMQKALLSQLESEDRGLRRARWAVLRGASMPAVLVEGGFMSEPREAKQIYHEPRRRQLAQAIVNGVLAYKRWMERPPSTPKKPATTTKAATPTRSSKSTPSNTKTTPASKP